MSYLDTYNLSKYTVERSNNRLTIKLASDIKGARAATGFCYLGWKCEHKIESFFEVDLEISSYMELIKNVADYFEGPLEKRKFTQEFETFLKNDWILDITTLYGFSIEFTKKDVIHLLRTPIFATYKNVVFFNYEERNFTEDFSTYFTCDMNFDLPIKFVHNSLKHLGWHLASN